MRWASGSRVAGRGEHVGVAVDDRDRVGGVAHPRAGQFGQQDFAVGAGFGVQTEPAAAHAVGVLRSDHEFASGGAATLPGDRIVLRGVVFGQQHSRFPPQHLWTLGDGDAGQLQIKAVPVRFACSIGQLGDGVADDSDVLHADQPVSGGRGRLLKHCLFAAEVGRGRDPGTGLRRGDVQQIGEVVAQTSTAASYRIAAEPVDCVVADHRQRPLHRLHAGDHLVGDVTRYRVPWQLEKIGRRGLQARDPRLHVVDLDRHRHSSIAIERMFEG